MKENQHQNLYEIVREAVHRQWDPIGVAELSDKMGEYDGYITGICKLVQQHATADAIFRYLWEVETSSMGLTGDQDATKNFSVWLSHLAS